jgi:hypothetical protein
LTWSINIIKINISNLKLNHFFKFSNNSKFLALVNAYGDKFLSFPLFPILADVAEYISFILFKTKLNTSFEPIVLD